MSQTPQKFAQVKDVAEKPGSTKVSPKAKRFSPLIVVGMTAVGGAILYGLYSMFTDKNESGINSNRAMRMRVIGQGAIVGTVCLFAAYTVWDRKREQAQHHKA